MADKMTDDEINAARTRGMMVLQIGYNDWAMTHEDAVALLGIFTRARHVTKVHTSDYRKEVWILADDQAPPFDAASVGQVVQSVEVSDPFSSATRAVS